MAITGILAGASGKFQVTPLPAGAALQAGSVPSWQASNAAVVLTPAADGLTVDVAVPATVTDAAFDLACSAVSSDGSALSATVSVPVLAPPPPPPPPPPTPATSLQIDQIG